MQNLKNSYTFGFFDKQKPFYSSPKGLSKKIVEEISCLKNEPKWMLEKRLNAFDIFCQKKMPIWGADLSGINFDDIYYYVKPTEKIVNKWDEIPSEIKNTFEKIGVPEAERKFLAGIGVQYDSETVYHNIKKMLSKKGVIFLSMDEALKKYPELVRTYFGTVIDANNNKFSALNSAVWSGGSFIYVPPNTKVDLPLQAYFRINAQNLGQFERTLIIADVGSSVHYIEGCTAPIYNTDSLHAAVVEMIVKKGAKIRFTTIQNWSKNVYNLSTKRMFVEEEGTGEIIDGNLGSKVTMKYPSIYLNGRKARGEILSLSLAGENQHQDTGAKAIHLASETNSVITSKSISKNTGRNIFRGVVKVAENAKNCRSKMSCYSLLLDNKSQASSFPSVIVKDNSAKVAHEAIISSIEEDQLFYLQSRGIPKKMAETLIVNGFAESIIKKIPLEYAIELNRLIQMEIEE